MASPSRSSGLPCGATFSPSDAELISMYLRPKIAGSPLPAPTAHYIHDADIYAAEPAALVACLLAASPKNDRETREWYFFTSVRAKSSRDTRRCRAVACGAGTWHSEKGRLEVLDGDDEVVGYRQFFTFEPRNGWLMLEFSVLDDREDGGHRGVAIPVLCKIYQTRRQSASKSARSKRKAERFGKCCSARVRRCLQFGSPHAAPNQLAVVPSTSGYEYGFLVPVESREEQKAEDPKEPDKQQDPWVTTTSTTFLVPLEKEAEQFGSPPPATPNQVAVAATHEEEFLVLDMPHQEQEAHDPTESNKQQEPWVATTPTAFFVPSEQEAEQWQYPEFAGESLIPKSPVTSYGTTPLHPRQDWATPGLSCYDGTTTSLPRYNTGGWSFPPSTLSSGNTLLYRRHDTSSMGNTTSVLGCYDASSMYSWRSETYAPRAPMSTREWANHRSNTNPLSYLCI